MSAEFYRSTQNSISHVNQAGIVVLDVWNVLLPSVQCYVARVRLLQRYGHSSTFKLRARSELVPANQEYPVPLSSQSSLGFYRYLGVAKARLVPSVMHRRS